MKKPLLASLLVVLSIASAMAVPARRTPFTVVQADGSTLTLLLQGDEHHHYYTTTGGMPVRCNAGGMYVPLSPWELSAARSRGLARAGARRDGDGDGLPAGVARATAQGERRVLVVLAQYPDVGFSQGEGARAAFTRHLNEEGYTAAGGYGSARDYFVAQSGGRFAPRFDVYGPYTVAHPMAYYGGNDADGGDRAAGELIAEALQLANDEVDYRSYDSDGDGTVDFVYVIYAGYGEAQGGGADAVWPHKWYLSAATGSSLKLDGVRVNEYACSNELSGNSGSDIDGIGTLCHEFGHCLGLPDFYDTEGNRFGMYSWSVMDYGCYNENGYTPAGYTAYEKEFLGWLDIETLDSEQEVTLTPTAEGGKAYRIESNENTDEYYIVENIRQRGWNRGAAGHGMLVTHVDYKASAWNSNTVNSTDRQRMTVVAADNRWTRTPTGAAGDPYPGTSGNSELSDSSEPAALTHDGNPFSRPITRIREEADGTITFSFMKGAGDVTTAKAATHITSSSFTAHWAKRPGTEEYTLEVFHITGDIPADKSQWNIALLNSQGVRIGTFHSGKLEMVVGNLEADNLYGYRVRCLKNGVRSPASNLIFVVTTPYEDALKTPSLNQPVARGDSTFTISWEAVEGAEAYLLEYEQLATAGGTGDGDGSTLLEERFSNVSIQHGEITRVLDIYTGTPDWRGQEVFGENECVRIGSTEEKGLLSTPYLPCTSGYVTIEFSVAKFDADDEKPILHICLATDADSRYYVDQLGAYITGTDDANYYCVLGPLDTGSYVAFISNTATGSDDHPMLRLDNIRIHWGDLSGLFEAPAAGRTRFMDDIHDAERMRRQQPGAEQVATSTKRYIEVEGTDYTFRNLEKGYYTFRLRAIQGAIRSPYSERLTYEVGNNTFEVDGLNYAIVSEEKMTVALTVLRDRRRYEGDIVIPETIRYEGETYHVTELADSVFRGCSDLRSVVIPPCISFAGSKIFKGCRKLAWVDWQGTAAIDSTNFIGTAYNTLVYVGKDVIVDSKDVIVVRDGQADSITVSLNGPFIVPRAFKANYIEYNKDFSQSTIIGTAAGWETVVLPFDVQKVSHEEKGVLTPFGTTGSDHHFWIGQYNGTAFEYVHAMKANIPYVVSMPNSTDYEENERIKGTICFSADNAMVEATIDVPRVSGEQFDFVPVYEKIYKAPDRYMLNTYDHAITGSPAGSVFTADRMSLRTFGAYMERKGNASAPRRFSIRFETPMPDDETILSTSDIYSIDGRRVRTASEVATPGETDGLPEGIYIVGGKKKIVR